MKKLFLFLASIAMVATVSAQAERVGLGDHKVGVEKHRVIIEGSAKDSVGLNTKSIGEVFDLSAKAGIQLYSVTVKLDSVSKSGVTADVPVILLGSYDNAVFDNYLDTVVFYGTSSDTSFKFEDLSTGTILPYLKVSVVAGDSLAVQLDKIFGTFFDK